MLAYRQAFASSVVKKYLTLFKHKWGAMRPTSEYCLQADYSWAITLYYRCGTHRPHLCLSLKSVRPARAYTLATRMMSANTPAAVTSAPAP